MSGLIESDGPCRGIQEPKFIPYEYDMENRITNGDGIDLVLYSNEEEWVNFLLQGISDKTEAVLRPYLGYTDGYAAMVIWKFTNLTQQSWHGNYQGFCLSSLNHGESCVALSPRGDATQSYYIEDIKSYWNEGRRMQGLPDTNYENSQVITDFQLI